jgi:hypothetical protein
MIVIHFNDEDNGDKVKDFLISKLDTTYRGFNGGVRRSRQPPLEPTKAAKTTEASPIGM